MTVPFAFTVYVPSPGTVTDVCVQLFGVSTGEIPHNFTEDGTHCADGVSFVNTAITWFVSYGPVFVSSTTVIAGAMTVGVIVALSI